MTPPSEDLRPFSVHNWHLPSCEFAEGEPWEDHSGYLEALGASRSLCTSDAERPWTRCLQPHISAAHLSGPPGSHLVHISRHEFRGGGKSEASHPGSHQGPSHQWHFHDVILMDSVFWDSRKRDN